MVLQTCFCCTGVVAIVKKSGSEFFRAFLLSLLALSGCGGEDASSKHAGKKKPPGPPPVAGPQAYVETGDLDALQKRGRLRILTRRLPDGYLPREGYPLGHEREMASEFARRQGLRLEVTVAPSNEDLLPMLVQGRGDMAANFLTPTKDRRAMGIEFSKPYHYAPEVVVARADDNKVKKMEDLTGRTIVVRRSSSHWPMIEEIRKGGIALKLQPAPETMETEEIIDKVAKGEYDLTVADGEMADIELAWRSDIQEAFALGEPVKYVREIRERYEAYLRLTEHQDKPLPHHEESVGKPTEGKK